MAAGGYCRDRDAVDHDISGVPRIDIFEDNARGDLFFTVTSLLSLLLLLIIEIMNRSRLRKSGGNQSSYVLLPTYFGYLTTMLFSNLFFVLMYLAHENLEKFLGSWDHVVPLAIHFSVIHFFFEAPTSFFMMSGASTRDVHLALQWGLRSAVLAFAIMFAAAYLYIFNNDTATPFTLFMIYQGVLVSFYATVVFYPALFISRRAALRPYAACMLLYNSIWSVMAIAMYTSKNDSSYCAMYFISFIMDGLYPPLVMYFAFAVDSQVRCAPVNAFFNF